MNRPGVSSEIHRFSDCIIDLKNRSVTLHGVEVPVQRRVFDLLAYLIVHRERVVDKQELLDAVWVGRVTTEDVLSRAVMKARQAVGDDSRSQAVIKTVHGKGYRFVARLEEECQAQRSAPQAGNPRRWRIAKPLFWITLLAAPAVAWFLAQAISGWHQTDHEAGAISLTVRPWRRAEALFQQDPLWRGGDGALSVDLGAGRVVWLFSDSFVSTVPRRDREGSVVVRNTVAIQSGYDPATAEIAFYWRVSGEVPGSFFPERDQFWYWPVNALLIDGRLLVFLVESKTVATGLGFEHTRVVAVEIQNPYQPPPDWRIERIELPANEQRILLGYSAVMQAGDHVFAFSKQEPTQDVYLARWRLEDLAAGQASGVEWWGGQEAGWLEAGVPLTLAEPVMTNSPTPFSVVRHEESNGFLLLGSWGFGHAAIAMRSAADLTGPWSGPQVVYRPTDEYRPGILIYGGRVHHGFAGADFIVSYDVNSERFDELLHDTSIYFPRLLRIDLGHPAGEAASSHAEDR